MIAYVLGGGGAKGAFQVGVMKKLHEQGVRPELIYGTSVGALNGTAYAYKGMEELESLWKGLTGLRSVYTPRLLSNLWSSGLFKPYPIRDTIREASTGEPSCEVLACAVDLETTAKAVISNMGSPIDLFRDAVLASSSIPFLVDAVPMLDGMWVDGGVRDIVPLNSAITRGADEIYVIMADVYSEKMPLKRLKWPKKTNALLRTISILEQEIMWNDVRKCKEYNERPDKKYIKLHVYAPDAALLDVYEFKPEPIRKSIEQGYHAEEQQIS